MNKHRHAYSVEHLKTLTVSSFLETAGETASMFRGLLEAAVAEVFKAGPEAWSVEMLERMLASDSQVERLCHGADIPVEEEAVLALRRTATLYRQRQRERFSLGRFTPLWPWIGLDRLCSHNPAYHECPYPSCEDHVSCFAAEPIRVLGRFDADAMGMGWPVLNHSLDADSEVKA